MTVTSHIYLLTALEVKLHVGLLGLTQVWQGWFLFEASGEGHFQLLGELDPGLVAPPSSVSVSLTFCSHGSL